LPWQFRLAGAARLAGLAQQWNGHGAEKAEIKSAQMFCEITLGQILGPNPGQGHNSVERNELGQITTVLNPHADSGLPPQRVKDFRRYYGWRDALIEAVRNGARSRRSLLLKVDQWITAGNEAPGRNAKAEKEIGLPAADRRELGRLRTPEKIFGGLYIC
jgi:hypothetical protein